MPTRLGPPAASTLGPGRQLSLAIEGEEPPRQRVEILPGAVHVPDWLGAARQAELAREFREWAEPPAGLRHPRVPGGGLMTTQAVCLGWHWYPYGYSRTADDTDGAPVKPLPPELVELGRAAVAEAYGADATEAVSFAPDASIVNFYTPDAHMGLHQDAEARDAPVVTLSLGDTCIFRLAGVDRRTGPFTDVELRSGDLLVFGRANRYVYHGVAKVLAHTAPPGLDLPPGRVSITLRDSGLC